MPPPLTLSLLDQADAAALLRQRIASRKWWVFIDVNCAGVPFLTELERRHFSGKASRHFEMLAFPLIAGVGIVGVALARKRRLPARQLSQLFDQFEMPRHAEAVAAGEHDVIVLAQSDEAGQQAALWLSQLLNQPVEAK